MVSELNFSDTTCQKTKNRRIVQFIFGLMIKHRLNNFQRGLVRIN